MQTNEHRQSKDKGAKKLTGSGYKTVFKALQISQISFNGEAESVSYKLKTGGHPPELTFL